MSMTRRGLVTAAAAGSVLVSAADAAITPAAIGTPQLIHVTDIIALLSPAIEGGDGILGARRIIPITGGEAKGPRFNGKVLSGGADFQLMRHDNLTDIQARYMLEAENGARIYVENSGIRRAAPDVMEKLKRGEPVDPALVYFRCTPRFETAAAEFDWMQRSIFICSGARYPSHVQLRIFEVT